jgi:hypothetical protein
MTTGEAASERGKRVIDTLMTAGRELGLEVQAEYPVVGGRIDVVWLWRTPALPEALPVAGFEVESSWRTRKHLKGDYLNLLDLQPALGVIVLLGEGPDVESTRAFARQMVERRPGRMLIWSEADVEALASGTMRGEPDREFASTLTAAEDVTEMMAGSVQHKGKYAPLAAWLVGETRDQIEATFEDLEEVLGFPLPPSARRHAAYWSGGQPGSTAGNAIRDAGWHARSVDVREGRLVLGRDGR